MSVGDADYFVFYPEDNAILVKKAGWYFVQATNLWPTVTPLGRMDASIRSSTSTYINTIFNTDSTTYDDYSFSSIAYINANEKVYIYISRTMSTTFFFHGCGVLVIYKLN